MARNILRILLGALLPIPLIVMADTIICDFFYFNKDSDYVRLADSSIKFIVFGFIWYSVLGIINFGIPCVIYSVLLEWRRRTGKRYLPVSFGLGGCYGLWIGFLFIPSLDRCGVLNYAEGFLHFIGVTLVFGLLVPSLLGCIYIRKKAGEQGVASNTL